MTPKTSPWQKWTGFWFTPTDPTVLGFIRVVTGLLVLYVHVAYSFDLQAFFGKNGWYGLDAINKERRELPRMLNPIDSYEETYRAANVPEYPHRREAVMKFIRGLPGDRVARTDVLRYLFRLQTLQYNVAVREGLDYLDRLAVVPELRKAQLDAMVTPKLRGPTDTVPQFLTDLPADGPDGKVAVRADIEKLLDFLPKEVFQRQYVLNHLTEMELGQRKLFLEFLDDLPADAAERAKVIDYMEYWNNEARRAYDLGSPIFSIWFHVSDPAEMAAAHGVIIFIMFLFTIGLFTRVTSVLTWLAAVGYIHRTQQVLFGMDTMMNILLVYLMVGDSGGAYSVDRLVNKYRAARRSLAATGTIDADTKRYLDRPPPSVSAGLAIRLLQVHFCVIYLASGLSKLKGAAWWNTTAFWDTMANPEFTLMQYQWYEWLVRKMVSNRLVFAAASAGGVLFTLAMEIGLPFLIWTRLRPYMVIGGVMLHFGIGVFMGLNLFGLLMMAMLLAYLPGRVIRGAFAAPPAPVVAADKLFVTFDPLDPRQTRAAALAAAFDPAGNVETKAAAGATYAVTRRGPPVTAADVLKPLGVVGILLLMVPGVRGKVLPSANVK